MLETVKKGQGLVVRRVGFWALTILILWGGQSLYTWMIGYEFGRNGLLGEELADTMVPVLNQRMNAGFLYSWIVVLGSVFVLWRLLNRPRTADFLIETDNEVKKVTWPSWKDAWHSSIIVVVFVMALTLFLLVSDWILSRGIRIIL